jgi:hypothetical protein
LLLSSDILLIKAMRRTLWRLLSAPDKKRIQLPLKMLRLNILVY